MVKKSKRKQDIKSKLMAAVAMLMVATIMMVSSTYAWFTLSTAPEVQGITTTIGANGSLEIALVPFDGDLSSIGNAGLGDADATWLEKNLTWGNLLDLSDASYGLGEITLLPSRLSINAGTATQLATLNEKMLMVPVYGADGRISGLDSSKVIMGSKNPASGVDGFVQMSGAAGYGIHAIGTSSTMSVTKTNFQNALVNINSYRGQANTLVGVALETYGTALGDIAILHGTATDGDEHDYAAYVDDLKGLTAELNKASDAVETALYNALLAIANTEAAAGKTIEGKTIYVQVKTIMETGAGLDTVWNIFNGQVDLNTQFPALADAYKAWEENKEAIDDTVTKLSAIDAAQTVTWTQIGGAMNGLMNSSYITMNGKAIKDLAVADVTSGSLILRLNAGSGVIANFGKLTGNITSQITLGDVTYLGQSLENVKINVTTTTEPKDGPLLTQVRSVISQLPVADEGDDVTSIDTTYAYAIDFAFRTNAASSSLLLQTEGAQRVYADSANALTQGNGSTMTFNSKVGDLESLASMMSGIRVVFIPMVSDDMEVYGIAKIALDDTPFTVTVTGANRTVSQIAGEEGKYEEVFTDAGSIAYEDFTVTVDAAGNITRIGVANQPHTYIVREDVEEDDGTTYERWTVKTAMYYTKTVTTVTEVESADGTPSFVSTSAQVDVELTDADGNVLFYPAADEDLNGDDEAEDTLKAAINDMGDLKDQNVTLNVAGDYITYTQNDKSAAEQVRANNKAPTYFNVADQEIEMEGELYLHNYTVDDDGMLVFGEVMDVQVLCSLSQNVATGVTAMVYLDGDYVDNADVVNSDNGISTTGILNLQFASSATLVPMENADLFTGVEHALTVNVDGATIDDTKVGGILDYTVPAAYVNQIKEVVVKVGDVEVSGAYQDGKVYIYDVTGDVVIDITTK